MEKQIGSLETGKLADDRYQALMQHMNEAAEAGLTSVPDAVTSLRTFGLYERASSEGARGSQRP